MRPFARSFREAPRDPRVADVDDGATVRLTVVLRPATPIDPARCVGAAMSRTAFGERHATSQAVLDRVAAYARAHGMRVEAADPARHCVKLSGTYAQARAAFQPDEMGVYESHGRRYVSRAGHLHVPADLADEIVAVQGFDQRPVASPRMRVLPRAAATVSYDPAQVAARYQFPTGADGGGQTVAMIELGGGFDPDATARAFAAKGVKRTGQLVSVSVDGAVNTPGDPSGADGEVQLDIEIAGSVAPGATVAVYFTTNSSGGFLDAIQSALHDPARDPSALSISWGGPESGWAGQDIDAMDQAFQSAAALGVTVCAASGDSGATDGAPDGRKTTDFPASSPNVLGCGGTSLPRTGAETAWNDGEGGASGGGFSAHFPQPAYQKGISGSGRGVPDVAGDADPRTGYNVSVDGQDTVVGGTSAVAPLWAGLVALLNQALGRRAGFINPVLYANPSALHDIVAGNNGGFAAGPGWDPVTGLGSPDGTAILAAARGAVSPAGS